MKQYHFFGIFSLLFLILVSCEKSLELSISSKEVIFDAYSDETQTIDISANVAWTAMVKQTGGWLTIDPMQWKGSTTITLTADENAEFTDRTALIIISGDGIPADTIMVLQTAGIDVAEEIEDETFKKYCLYEFDRFPKDNKLSLKEVKGVKTINVKRLKIASFAGIKYFKNLEVLDCSENLLKSIDISKNKELLVLDCSYNPMPKIDVSENVKLTDLILKDMGLTGIDLRQNTALRKLEIFNNPITNLDVNNNKELEYLNCNETQLAKLEVNTNTRLKSLFCVNNKCTVLDVNQNVLLEILCCDNNSLGSLDVRQNPELKILTCAGNRLDRLDVSKNVKLIQLYCERNNLTGSINLTINKSLEAFDFRKNPLLNTIVIWQGFRPDNDVHLIDTPPTTYQYQ